MDDRPATTELRWSCPKITGHVSFGYTRNFRSKCVAILSINIQDSQQNHWTMKYRSSLPHDYSKNISVKVLSKYLQWVCFFASVIFSTSSYSDHNHSGLGSLDKGFVSRGVCNRHPTCLCCSLSNRARRSWNIEVVASIQCHILILNSCITDPESRKYLVESIPKLKPKTTPVKCTN